MPKKILLKVGVPLVALSLVVACGTTDEEGPIEDEAPLNQEENNEPTENEMDDDFGEELDEDVERDIPENDLESDEETESDN